MFEESLVVFGKDCKLTEVTEHHTHTKTSTESENVRHHVFTPFLVDGVQVHEWVLAPSCPALCDPVDCSPPVPSSHRISQARLLQRMPFPLPRHLPRSGIKPESLASCALAGRYGTTAPPGKLLRVHNLVCKVTLQTLKLKHLTGGRTVASEGQLHSSAQHSNEVEVFQIQHSLLLRPNCTIFACLPAYCLVT